MAFDSDGPKDPAIAAMAKAAKQPIEILEDTVEISGTPQVDGESAFLVKADTKDRAGQKIEMQAMVVKYRGSYVALMVTAEGKPIYHNERFAQTLAKAAPKQTSP